MIYKSRYVLLFLLLAGFLLYLPILLHPAPNLDDSILQTTIEHTDNPLVFFVGDWGLHNNLYRPLHSLSLWIVSRVANSIAFLNPLVNVLLHLLIVGLLFNLLIQLGRGIFTALLIAGFVLVSPYTQSSATWVSDRPTLFVALTLIAFLSHLLLNKQPRLLIVIPLAIISLLSKESGVLLPLLMVVVLFDRNVQNRKYIALAGVLLLFCYFVLRLVLFGTFSSSYTLEGYLLGTFPYASTGDLPPVLRMLAYTENVVKAIVAVILPVFSASGSLHAERGLAMMLGYGALTLVPFLLSIGQRLSRVQKYALAIIVINAVVHFAMFRYRNLYLAEIGYALFLFRIC